jgi:hypothetical protein
VVDKVVANAMLVNRSVKAIPNNVPCFLVIVTDLHKFNKNDSREKIEKLLYTYVTPVTIVLPKVNYGTAS